jgi:NifU-like protein involved in Fe-S cluster formation
VDREIDKPNNGLVQLGEAFWAHGLTPSNVGIISPADGFASQATDCGDRLELYLRVRGEVITAARYLAEGCLHTVACGSALTTLVKGLKVNQAARVGAGEIDGELGGMGPAHRHCAEMAASVLRAALRDYFHKRQAPWKTPYQVR